MKSRLKAVAGLSAATLVAGVGLVAGATTAQAITPSWGVDPASVGRISFWDATGAPVTGGALTGTGSRIAAYASVNGATSLTGGSGASLNKLQILPANPSSTLPIGSWATDPAFTASLTINPAGLPANLQATVTNGGTVIAIPVSQGNLVSTLGGFAPDSSAQYGNKLQLRGVTNGPNYFTAVLAVNTTGAPITASSSAAAGTVTVPANSWVLFDPDTTATTTAVSASIASPQIAGSTGAAGSPITLTATVTGVTGAGQGFVQFAAGGTNIGTPVAVGAGGTAVSTSVTPANGSTNYTATFIPNAPVGSAPLLLGSAGGLTYLVNNPATPTTSSVSANPGTAQQYTNVTLTATVTPAAAAGTFQFTANGVNIGAPVAVSGGSATLVTNNLPLGNVAVGGNFIPANNAVYQASVSPTTPVVISAPSCPGTPIANPNVTLANGYTAAQVAASASCEDPQTITVTVNPGTITVTTPYTPVNPFVLPAMTLNAGGTLLSTNAGFPAAADKGIVVTSTLSGDPIWTLSAQCTDLQGITPANKINGQNVGFTGTTLLNGTAAGATAYDTAVSNAPGTTPVFSKGFTPVAGAVQPANGVLAADPGTAGLKGSPKALGTTNTGGNGTAVFRGTLVVNAPTVTNADTYTGTLTFTVG